MGIVRGASWRVFEGGGFVGWEQLPFATFCDFCGQPPVIETKGAHAKTRRREERRGGGLVGEDGYLGGFEALRLVRLVFGGVGFWRGRGNGGARRGEGFCRPAGAGFRRGDGTQRSRAGLLSGGPPGVGPWSGKTEAAKVHRDRTRFFPVSFRYRCRYRCVRRGFVGRAHRPPGACRSGSFVGWEQCPFATFCDFCGYPPVIEAKGAHAKARRREGGGGRDPVWVGFVSVVDLLVGQRRRVEPRSARAAGLAHAKTQRRKGGKTGCHSLPVLGSLRLERSGREESVRAGSCCQVCEEAGNLSPLPGLFFIGGWNPALTRWATV